MAWSIDPGSVPMGSKPLEHPSYQYEQLSHQGGGDVESGARSSHPATLEDSSETDPFSQPLTFHPPIPMVRTEDSDASRLSLGSQATMVSTSANSTAIQAHQQRVASRSVRRCRKCNDNYKPPRAHHDSVTGRCVVKMDHYCPWVGNAVGVMNHKFFLLFLLYTFLCCASAIPIIVMKFIKCNSEVDYNPDNMNQRVSMYTGCQRLLSPPVMALVVATILFFFFTVCMLGDQYLSVTQNVSKIARMKINRSRDDAAENGDELGRVANDFNEMFGTNGEAARPGFQWHWLVPSEVKFPPEMHDEIMGYRDPGSVGEQQQAWRPPHFLARGGSKVPSASVSSRASNTSASTSPHKGVNPMLAAPSRSLHSTDTESGNGIASPLMSNEMTTEGEEAVASASGMQITTSLSGSSFGLNQRRTVGSAPSSGNNSFDPNGAATATKSGYVEMNSAASEPGAPYLTTTPVPSNRSARSTTDAATSIESQVQQGSGKNVLDGEYA
jgi:hypothetical protein